jgi:hypothetical protein
MIPGCVIEVRLTQLTQDIHDNWDTTYSVNVFPSAKAFDGRRSMPLKTGIFQV